MVTRLNESNYGYTSSAQSVWNELYVDPDTNKIYEDYLADNVDIWLFNTESLYNELKNKRRKSYSIVYEALLSLFQSNVNDNLYPKKVRITSEMVQSWFRKHNADFKAVLKPVVDKVEEERQELNSADYSESVSIKENANGTDKYRLVDYFDVWGNEEDGFEVNNLAVIENDITISDDATEQDILDLLYNMEYLNTKDPSKINVEMFDPDMIELFDAKTECPICRLERVY